MGCSARMGLGFRRSEDAVRWSCQENMLRAYCRLCSDRETSFRGEDNPCVNESIAARFPGWQCGEET